MGLDVGVVNITYLERPDELVNDFLIALASGPLRPEWRVRGAGNAFIEATQERFSHELERWIETRKLEEEDKVNLTNWLEALPWDGDTVMLHLNW